VDVYIQKKKDIIKMDKKLSLYKEILTKDAKNIFILFSMLLALPSLVYLIENKSILYFTEWFTYFLEAPNNRLESVSNMICFAFVFITLIVLYFCIIKNTKKLFRNKNDVFVFIILISIIFGAMIPFTTSDLFYYMGTGWVDAKYNENPYYVSVKDVKDSLDYEDEILDRTGYWQESKVVYGPVWVLFCKVLSALSFGNATLGMYIYKLMAILVHILSCLLIYKITNKEKFTLIYGINPFILFEGLTNGHNDTYLILFILFAIYFLLKKKNIVATLIFLALATAVKYVAIILVPFLTLYYFRNKTPIKRIGYSLLCAIPFLIVFASCYLIYIRDTSMISVIILQQEKYRESILFLILTLFSKIGIERATIDVVKKLFLFLFVLMYTFGVIDVIFSRKITFTDIVRKCNKMIFVFLFFIITNLCPWYVMWLFPLIFWQKGKNFKLIIYIGFAYEFCILYNIALYSESYEIGVWYIPTMILLVGIMWFIDKKCKQKEIGEKDGQVSCN